MAAEIMILLTAPAVRRTMCPGVSCMWRREVYYDNLKRNRLRSCRDKVANTDPSHRQAANPLVFQNPSCPSLLTEGYRAVSKRLYGDELSDEGGETLAAGRHLSGVILLWTLTLFRKKSDVSCMIMSWSFPSHSHLRFGSRFRA
jgi:hypothetical protein